MAVTVSMLFYGAATIFFVLWFLDEILSLRNIKKYGTKSGLNPAIGWFLHHHAKRLIYIKLVFYAVSAIVLSEVLKKYVELFHVLTVVYIIIYLIFDIQVMRKFRKNN